MRTAPDHGPSLVMADRAGRPEHSPEAEPVLIDYFDGRLTLTLDDGERITFDAAELLACDAVRAAYAALLDLDVAA